jgi:ribosomal protein S3
VARKAAKELEMGKKARAIMYKLLNNIMQNGAVGAEIVALGKIGAKGAKSKKIKVYAGFVPKAGNPVKDVRTVHYATVTKSGVIGITVRIAPPGIYLPDKMDRIKKEVVIEEGPAKAGETKEVAKDAVAKS